MLNLPMLYTLYGLYAFSVILLYGKKTFFLEKHIFIKMNFSGEPYEAYKVYKGYNFTLNQCG